MGWRFLFGVVNCRGVRLNNFAYLFTFSTLGTLAKPASVDLFYRWVQLSGAPLQNLPPPQKPTCAQPQTHVKATSEAWPQTGEADQSITSLLQQSNKVIIRQRLADLERPGQSKPAVM